MSFKIAEARAKKNMGQQELAEKSGVSRAIISGLESGRVKNTTVTTLFKIAKALDCSVEDIFFADEI